MFGFFRSRPKAIDLLTFGIALWGCGGGSGASGSLDLSAVADVPKDSSDFGTLPGPEGSEIREPDGWVSLDGMDQDGDPEGAETGPIVCRESSDCERAHGGAPSCRIWTCSEGTCLLADASEGVPCDDGNACTRDDRCRKGRCIGSPIQCPETSGPCQGSVCDPARGCVDHPRTGDRCEDGDPCTADDRCLVGTCRGVPVRCDDGDPCTEEVCDPEIGCVAEVVVGRPCDDGEPCTVGDACRSDGTCRGEPDDCDDGNPCTEDSCAPGEGCRHRPLHGPSCDDRSVCTEDDHCESGRCVGKLVDCRDGNPCTRDVCDPERGCVHLPDDGVPCNDGNPCTDLDLCLEGTCQGSATACEDGNPCTLDSCIGTSGCIHRALSGTPCEDGDACTGNDRCLQGLCLSGAPVDCDDGNPCTTDLCDSRRGCVHERLPGGTPCDDGDACTAGDRCLYGACVGETISCDDVDPCTVDSCDPRIGCLHRPKDGPCDDGDPCTAGDFCAEGRCLPGRNPQCLAVRRIVLAGDSWSTGLVGPLRQALDARGYEEVEVSWETTSKPGSTVAGWIGDPALLGALFEALDREPRAEMLLFTLSGNDYLRACRDGLGRQDAWGWYLTLSRIQADLQSFVNLVRNGRPHLRIVLIGYDYLNYLVIEALLGGFPGMDLVEFNLGLVELSARGRAVAEATPGMVYGHNLGVLQHVFGDPWFGYGPGEAPRPGPAPTYSPFPGGWWTHPSPAGHIPDGIHPDAEGFRAIIENTLDQGPAAFIEGRPWP